ncbi:MAG: hypothetical protein ACK40G_06075 [Cytophagaceae bacterium]
MQKSVLSLLVLFCGLFFSCKKDNIDPQGNFTVYTIKQGSQSSNSGVRLFSGKSLRFTARFDSTAVYSTTNPRNQHDINKLYGFSDCSSKHHENSARFGWRWTNNELQIFAYTYKGGVRSSQHVTNVRLNADYNFQIEISGKEYVFTVNGATVRMGRQCSGNGGLKYYLYPYFGGDESAPHDISIRINEQ